MVHGSPHPHGFIENQYVGFPRDWRLPRCGNVGNWDALYGLKVVAEWRHITLLSSVLKDDTIGTSHDCISVGVKLAVSIDSTIGIAQAAAQSSQPRGRDASIR